MSIECIPLITLSIKAQCLFLIVFIHPILTFLRNNENWFKKPSIGDNDDDDDDDDDYGENTIILDENR